MNMDAKSLFVVRCVCKLFTYKLKLDQCMQHDKEVGYTNFDTAMHSSAEGEGCKHVGWTCQSAGSTCGPVAPALEAEYPGEGSGLALDWEAEDLPTSISRHINFSKGLSLEASSSSHDSLKP